MAFDFKAGTNGGNGGNGGGSNGRSNPTDRFININVVDPNADGRWLSKLGTLYLRKSDPVQAKLIEQLDAHGELDADDTKALLMHVLSSAMIGMTYKTGEKDLSAVADVDLTAGFTPKGGAAKKAS